jgi:activator of 2-hydroxyglutaryl-CoA dehydratase
MEKNSKGKKKSNQAKERKTPARQGSGSELQSAKKGVQEPLGKLKQEATTENARMSKQSARGVDQDRCSIGIDLGDKRSRYCILDVRGEIVAEGSMATRREEFASYFSALPKARVALEVGTH